MALFLSCIFCVFFVLVCFSFLFFVFVSFPFLPFFSYSQCSEISWTVRNGIPFYLIYCSLHYWLKLSSIFSFLFCVCVCVIVCAWREGGGGARVCFLLFLFCLSVFWSLLLCQLYSLASGAVWSVLGLVGQASVYCESITPSIAGSSHATLLYSFSYTAWCLACYGSVLQLVGQVSISTLWKDEIASLVCNFLLGVAALKIAQTDPSLRQTLLVSGVISNVGADYACELCSARTFFSMVELYSWLIEVITYLLILSLAPHNVHMLILLVL